ncbi:MAG TPA: ABC transporter ATP-binding protein [Candidatus Paceibacterota bacterium]
MQPDKIYPTTSLIRELLGAIRPYRARFIAATLVRIAGEVAWLYPAYALAAITNFFTSYQQGQSLQGFWNIMALFALTNAVYFVGTYLSSFWGFRIAKRAAIDIELRAMRHTYSLDMDWHEKENTGNRVKRIARGTDAVNNLIRMWFYSFIEIAVSIFGVLIVIAKFDGPIATATVVFLILYFFMSVYLTNRAVKVQKVEHIKEEELSGLVFELVNNIRSAKIMSMIQPLMGRLTKVCKEYYLLCERRLHLYQIGGATKNLSAQVFRIAVMCYIGWGILKGNYDLGFMVLFYTYFGRIQAAVSRMAETSQDFAVRKQAVARLADLFETKPMTEIEEGKKPFPSDWKSIEFRDVSFSYGEKKVLDNINLTISRGEKIGIMGLSGAGKSTLFKLLLKERETYTGEILVDGTPLRTISKSDYFNHTAVVLQDTEVFNFSLKENIVLSNYDKADDAKLLDKALNVAHVSEFAKTLPLGVDTQIGEKGIRLSGGEKQRVGVARAVFKDPELLLLDEATSHLDVESEEKIQDSLHQFFKTVTAVVIAHRLTTIKEMDKIVVIEGGKILEQGSFADLYGKKGRFFELWEKQKL